MSAAADTTAGVHRPWRMVVGVLVATIAAAGAVLWLRSLEWPIDVVRIEGETRYSDRERLQRIVSAHVRDGFFGTDLPDLRDDLIAMPWVRDASLRRVWPARLDVEIREHSAAAVWNEDALISEHGEVFRPEAFDAGDLPRLSGPEGQAPLMLARFAEFGLRLNAVGMEIAAIEQDARRSWTVALDDGLRVRLGRQSVDERIDRLVAAWPSVIAGQRARIDTVDLRYPNGFAIAWRENASDSPEGGA